MAIAFRPGSEIVGPARSLRIAREVDVFVASGTAAIVGLRAGIRPRRLDPVALRGAQTAAGR